MIISEDCSKMGSMGIAEMTGELPPIKLCGYPSTVLKKLYTTCALPRTFASLSTESSPR